MATVEKLREGVFIVSWINPTYVYTGQTTINIEEISQSCQLSYTVNTSNNTTSLVIEFTTNLPSKVKNPQVMEPSSVLATKFGVRQPLILQNSKWTTTFPTSYFCCGKKGLIFEIVIDFVSKTKLLINTEAKRVLDHVSNLWKTKNLADVTFKIKDKEVKAHTLILASGSPVLAAIFKNNLKEKEDKVVEIQDVKPSVFEKMLRFIYTGSIDFERVNASELLVVADKYGVNSLKEECAIRLAEDLTVENATQLLVMSHLHSSTNLYEVTLDFMSKNAKAICSRKEWMEVIKNYPELSFVAMQLMVMG